LRGPGSHEGDRELEHNEASRGDRLHVYEYDLSLPAQEAYEETYDISGGKNVIDLSGFGNSILSLKLDEADLRARIIVDLLQ